MLELENTKLMLEELGIGKGEQHQETEGELICEPETVDMAAESPTAEDLLNENFHNSNFKNCHYDDEGQD